MNFIYEHPAADNILLQFSPLYRNLDNQILHRNIWITSVYVCLDSRWVQRQHKFNNDQRDFSMPTQNVTGVGFAMVLNPTSIPS